MAMLALAVIQLCGAAAGAVKDELSSLQKLLLAEGTSPAGDFGKLLYPRLNSSFENYPGTPAFPGHTGDTFWLAEPRFPLCSGLKALSHLQKGAVGSLEAGNPKG